MSRMRFKGGAWTNSEDEVLRASLSVYGLHNWERVASMLVRKTAAQCRERWESHLDPRLNLQEAWTASEEAALVELHALFPQQWGLIAQELRHRTGMNRPPWLCEEHYHSLLDALEYERRQRRKTEGDVSTSGGNNENNKNNNRKDSLTLEEFLEERRRQRSVHQGYETRAARPDAVNSDVFEKEMVEFAVSRLANQDGKKGLRKERKKQLEHTSFLAKLESNRESIESGTLSAKAKKRMDRAMLEDLAGPSGTRLQDNIVEDGADDDDDNEEEEEGNEEEDQQQQLKKRKQEAFQPIDLGADKQAAGIQAKQRVLVKNLSASSTQHSQDDAVKEGVNMELLRLASGMPTTGGNKRLENKKSVSFLTGIKMETGTGLANQNDSASNTVTNSEKNVPDLDDLFATLPDVMTSTQKKETHVDVLSDDLFATLPAPKPTSSSDSSNNSVNEELVTDTVPLPLERELMTVETEEEKEKEETLDFTTPSGRLWLTEAKRRVALENERTFLKCKRVRRNSLDRSISLHHQQQDDKKKEEEEEEDVDDVEDDNTQRVVRALVLNQMSATARQLLNGKVIRDEPAKKKRKHSSNNDNKGEEQEAVERETKEEEEEEELSAKLADRVAAVREEECGDFWKSVGATEATVQLEELVSHQREHVASVTESAIEAEKKAERIVRVCFAPFGDPQMRYDDVVNNNNNNKNLESRRGSDGDVVRRACVYWGGKLVDAQRELAFYTAMRGDEQQEIQRRVDAATHTLEEIEEKERVLQELYRSMRLEHA
ncbi:putative cell division control protein [Trypanosoma theileri]|uniref:Putative cell division control protein n=1 Tax=Trypanosoma theileri TaxID=67003 RepID=A0A1X0NSS9_9TRYP|nr:putative cell division control protein [Trypanosoma theileri]ORC87775.1 putative cell division control protein [Trypanosoma theileri]